MILTKANGTSEIKNVSKLEHAFLMCVSYNRSVRQIPFKSENFDNELTLFETMPIYLDSFTKNNTFYNVRAL